MFTQDYASTTIDNSTFLSNQSATRRLGRRRSEVVWLPDVLGHRLGTPTEELGVGADAPGPDLNSLGCYVPGNDSDKR